MNLKTPSKPTLISERVVPEPRQQNLPVFPTAPFPDLARSSTNATTSPEPPPASMAPSPASNRAFLETVLATLSAIAMMLSARLILLMTGIGSFILAYLAIQNATPMTLMAAGTYDVLVLIPMVALYWHRG